MIELSRKIIDLIENARSFVVKATNTSMIFSYFSIGKMIVVELQSGNEKAEYGTQLLEKVSTDLMQKLGRGFSVDNLENMRNFYLTYMNQIQISENASRYLDNKLISEKLSRKLPNQFLSWSHYVFLSKIDNEAENPTIGIILCKHKNQSMVEITLPAGNKQIYASKYQTIIPDKKDFIKLLRQYDEK